MGTAIPGTGSQVVDRLLDVPRWSASVSGEYERPVSYSESWFVRLDFTDRDGANALYDRTSPFYHYDGFATTNLRIGLERADRKWSAALFLDNAFDKLGETALPVASFADIPTTRRIAVNTPRTIGVMFNMQF